MDRPPTTGDARHAVRMLGLAQAFREMSAVTDAFGQLVHDEAEPAAHHRSPDVRALREALEGLQETRARFEDLLATDSRPTMLELHAAVLSTSKRLLQETDLGARLRRQLRLGRATRRRMPPFVPTRPAASPGGSTPEAETQPMPRLPGGDSDARG